MAWAIVFATLLGPIFAVLISLWREQRTALYNRRLWVFRTLMATRRVGISTNHVNALNMVEVDFYKCPKIEAAWAVYHTYLNDTSKTENEAWYVEKEKLLSKLLFEIGVVLKFDIQAIDIFKGGYAPKGWAHRDARQMGALEYVYQLSEGQKSCRS
jgi:hypothetical protein